MHSHYYNEDIIAYIDLIYFKDVKSFPGTRDPKIIPDPGKYISRTGIPVCVFLDVKNA